MTGSRVAFSLICLTGLLPGAPPSVSIDGFLKTLKNPQQAKSSATLTPAEFGWNLFLLLNWPTAAQKRGVPDLTKKIGDPGPVLWQTWKSTSEVYVNPGLTPLPWGQPTVGLPVLQHNMIDGRALLDNNNNPVMYEVRMDEAAFNFIVLNKLYQFDVQVALRNSPPQPPISFPTDAMEIKASWRILDPEKDKAMLGRYFTQRVTYIGSDCSKVNLLVGLTGLHISSKILPDWYWVTFEQIDNATTTKAKLNLPIAPDVARLNASMQQKLAGTPWGFYRMDGYQTQFVDANNKPTLLANSQMETNFQQSSSCITCHNLASIGAVTNLSGVRFPFFQAGSQGFVGNPPSAPFGPGPKQYTRLDYVWSLREAKRKPVTTGCAQ